MTPHDIAFLKAALQQRLLTPAHQQAAARIRGLLEKHGVVKSVADIAVEAGWMKAEQAAQLARRVPGHPELRPQPSASASDRAALPPAPMSALQRLSQELAKLGYRRSAADLAADGARPPAGPAARPRTASPAPRPEPRRLNPRLLFALGGGVAALAVAAAVVIALSGGKEPTAQPKESETAASTPTKPSDKGETPPPSKREPTKEELEAQMRREMEEMRLKTARENEKKAEDLFAEGKRLLAAGKFEEAYKAFWDLDRYVATDFCKPRQEEISKLRDEANAKRKAAAAAPKPEPEKKPEGPDLAKLDYERRKNERYTEGLKRLDAAKAEIRKAREAEAKKMENLRLRIAGLKFVLRTKAGVALRNAGILAIGRQELKISYDLEGTAAQTSITWDVLDDSSFAAVIRAIYRDRDAESWYEMGRQFVLRKMWRDAQSAFDQCKKADPSWEKRVPDLTKVLKNQGAFNGLSRRLARDVLSISYDFSAPDQAEDFQDGPGGGAKELTADGLELKARAPGFWTFKDVEVQGEILIEATIAVDADAAAAFLLLGSPIDRTYYELSLGNGKGGFELTRVSGEKRDAVVKKADATVPGQAAIRVTVKAGEFKLYVDGKEALTAKDETLKKGLCGIGAAGGKVTFKKLAVQAKVNPVEIDKRFAESEVLVRRAMEDDLSSSGSAEEEEREVKEIVLSAEDDYFLRKLTDEQKQQYESAKREALRIIQTGVASFEDLSAARQFEPILSAVPDFHAALYWQGMVNLAVGNTPQARRCFIRCTKNPDFYEAYAAAGAAWEDDQDWDKADYYAGEALKRMPDYAPALGLRGFLTFVIRADSKSALDDLELSLKLDPSSEAIRQKQKSLVNVVKGPEHLGCRFKKEFPHYWVMTDMSMEKTQIYGERLEAAYKHYAETFKEFFKEDPKRIKPRVAIFNTREAYLTYGELTLLHRQENALGYFIPPFRELLLFEDVDLDETLHVLYHEAFHQFMRMMVSRPPFWYNEGMAEYMGAIIVDKGKVVKKAQVLEGRLKVLRQDVDRAFPFEYLMKQSPGEFYSGPVGFKYAQAWTMVHFFQEFAGGKHRKLLDDYFRALLEGKDGEDAYDAAFGKADLEELKKEWEGHVAKLELPKKP